MAFCYIVETRLENAIEKIGMKDDVKIDYRSENAVGDGAPTMF